MNPSEDIQKEVMQQIASRLSDTPYVLKGGAALMLTRDLDRHSTDLDFDSGKRLNLEGRIREGVKAAGLELTRLKAVKDTDTVQRYKLHYLDPSSGETALLKIETSFRQPPSLDAVEVVNNIKTYNASYLFDQKMNATESRTVARDLYDITHLIKTHGDKLTPEQISRVDNFSRDIDQLAAHFADSFETDKNLSQISTVEETVIKLRESVEEVIGQGNNLAPEKTLVPGSREDVIDAARYIAKELGDYDGSGIYDYEDKHFRVEACGQELTVWDSEGDKVIEISQSDQEKYQPSSELVDRLTSTANELEEYSMELEFESEEQIEVDDGFGIDDD